MTTTVYTARGSGLSFVGLLRSEWIKLTTLRSTIWCYAIMFVLNIGLGLLLATFVRAAGSTSLATQQSLWVQSTTLGISFSQLVVAVLGALVITGEYSTGMIRSTFAAEPRRVPALLAKATVFALTTFVVGFVSLIVTALVAAPVLGSHDINADFGDGEVWRALLGGAIYLALVGLIALAIGIIVRSSAGGVSGALGLIFVAPIIFQIIAGLTQAKWAANVQSFLPSEAGVKLYSYATGVVQQTTSGIVMLEPWQGLLVVIGWVVVIGAIAAVLVRRRDA